MRRLLVILALAGGLAGCGILPRNAVPVDSMGQARIAGFDGVRASGARLDPAMQDDLVQSFAQERPETFPADRDGRVRYDFLAVSGGGPNGAFGAGLLQGWSEVGTRPVFKIVTGVSTGALMAPFAFLGAEFDAELARFYTTTATNNIFERRSLLPQLLRGEALTDTTPLARLIQASVTEDLLERIAQAHREGRRLYVGTTNLDAQTFVVWNMGRIATSGDPGALALFRKVLLASASIPVAFPPVFFDVMVGDRTFDEMHVDGAVAANVFVSGGVYNLRLARAAAGRPAAEDRLYVIHNGQLKSEPEVTRRTLRAIAVRVFDSTTKAATLGDLFRIGLLGERDRMRVLWVTIPGDFDLSGGSEVFDPEVMTRLFERGVAVGRNADPWRRQLPGMVEGGGAAAQ